MQLLEVIWRDPCLFYLDYPDTIHNQDVNIDNIQVQIQNTFVTTGYLILTFYSHTPTYLPYLVPP